MQPTSLEAWLQGYAQLSSVSAVLGGFAFTFLAVLLTYRSRSRLIGFAAALLTISAACFLIDAFGWSLIATHAANFGRPAPGSPEHASMLERHGTLSMALVIGTFCFLAALGLSGWVRSKTLGVASTLITLIAGRVLVSVAGPYIEFTFRVSVDFGPGVWVLLVLLAILGGAIYYWRRRRARRAPVPTLPD